MAYRTLPICIFTEHVELITKRELSKNPHLTGDPYITINSFRLYYSSEIDHKSSLNATKRLALVSWNTIYY